MIIIKRLAKTVIAVTAFSCAERGLGFLYRIFLSRAIGAEGLGLYQIALSVVGVLMTVSASGIPITVSRLMIKERAANKKLGELSTVSAGVTLTAAVCLPIVLILFAFRNDLVFLFADERSVTVFLIILPGVFLTSVYAVIRGFFWGRKYFYSYSVIELLEEIVMIVVGVFLVCESVGTYQKTTAAAVAVLVSYIFSFLTASITFFVRGGRLKNPLPELKPLFISSAPITLMRTATSLSGFLIAVILPAALITGGVPKNQAIAEFGVISGMTMPLLFMPSTIIGSISLVLVPELAENFYKKQNFSLQSNVEKALLYSAGIAIFIIPVFCGCGKFIGSFVYGNELAGEYLTFAAPIMLPMSVTMISNSLLNSMGMERKTLLYFGIGSAFLILCVWLLPPYIGNYSLILGYFLNYCVTAVLNIGLLQKICCSRLLFKSKLVIGLCCLPPAVCLCFFTFALFSKLTLGIFAFVLSGGLTAACLYLTLLALGFFSNEKSGLKLKTKRRNTQKITAKNTLTSELKKS